MFIANDSTWDDLFYRKTASIHPTTPPVQATFVSEFSPVENTYGEYERGGEDTWMVFKVGEKYYKKYGRISSYGERSWSGNVVEVSKTTRTVEVFE